MDKIPLIGTAVVERVIGRHFHKSPIEGTLFRWKGDYFLSEQVLLRRFRVSVRNEETSVKRVLAVATHYFYFIIRTGFSPLSRGQTDTVTHIHCMELFSRFPLSCFRISIIRSLKQIYNFVASGWGRLHCSSPPNKRLIFTSITSHV